MRDLLRQHLPVQRFTLENGLKVLIVEHHTVPIVSCHTLFRVGSRNERTGLTGISHLFEHLMFNGSEKFGPQEFDRILESSGGYSNAYTARDMTVYYESFPPDILDTVLDLNADRMRALRIDPESLESEREVVKEERRMRAENSVLGRMEEDLYASAYVAHPYQWPILGWMSDLQAITVDDCREFFETYYAPNNALLVLVGAVDADRALERIRHFYEDIPAQAQPRPVTVREPAQCGERRLKCHKPAQLPAFLAAYHVPDVRSADVLALDALQIILSEGDSSRLYQQMVERRHLATTLWADFTWRLDPSLFSFYVQMQPGQSTARGEAALYKGLDRVKERGISSRELQKTRNIVTAMFLKSLKTADGIGDKIGVFEFLFDDYESLFDIYDGYQSLKVEDIQRVARDYFNDRNRTVVTLVPDTVPEPEEAAP